MTQLSFGSGRLFGTRTDIANSTPAPMGILQDVQLSITGDLKPLYGSNIFAEELARGKMKVEGKAKAAKINANLLNSLYFGQSQATGQTLTSLGETATVPAASPYTVTAANGATFVADLGVVYQSSGVLLTKVAAAPTQGQYSVSAAGVYTFAAADVNTPIALNYDYTATSGYTITLNQVASGALPYFQAEFTTTFNGKILVVKLFRCGSSKLTIATKQDDWTIPEFDFEAVANASGVLGIISLSE